MSFAFAQLACSGGAEVTPPCVVGRFSVTAPATTIIVGQSITASATFSAQNCSPLPTLTWTSSNTAIATVAPDGRITGVAIGGPVVIQASTTGQSGVVSVSVIAIPVATVTLAPSTANLLPTQSVDLVATARDGSSTILTGRIVAWASSNATVATVLNGRVSAVAPGSATITATVEGVSATAAVVVATPTYLAYGLANNPVASASYLASEAFTGAGDAPTVVRVGVGSYEVTVPGMASSNASPRFAQITSRTSAAQCHPNGNPANGSNGSMILRVICGALTNGAATDAPFAFFVLGRDAFAGRTGFMVTPSAALASTPFQPTSPFTYTSRGTDANITVQGTATAGRYGLLFSALARVGTDFPESHFAQSWGTVAGTWCASGGWSFTEFQADVFCYDQSGVLVNERFGSLVIDNGRVGKRFAVAWIDSPTTATPPVATYARSTGGTISLVRTAAGFHDITFAGLGTGTAPVSVIVSSYGGSSSNSHCGVSSITRTGADLVVRTYCLSPVSTFNVDQRFTIAVIE